VVDAQGYQILTTPARFEAVQQAVETRGIPTESAEITALAFEPVRLGDASTLEAVTRLLEALDDHEDVQQVYSNAELPADH